MQITVRDALREGMAQLRAAKVPSHALAAELLLMHAIACDRAWIYAHPEVGLDEFAAQSFLRLIAQRASGIPTQYLTGKQEFWGMEFEVTPAVLIPRPETEHVIEVALERLGTRQHPDTPLNIADVGTGSGCIGVALAKELPTAKFFATDISAGALEIAKRNAERNGVSQRIHFVQCDLLDGVMGKGEFDLIVSNPPYVARLEEPDLPREVREHEPHAALFGGANGTEIYGRLIQQASESLRRGGLLVLEIGYGAAEQVRAMFKEDSWNDVRASKDLAGIPRVVSAERSDEI